MAGDVRDKETLAVEEHGASLDQALQTLTTSATLPISIAHTLAVESGPVRTSQPVPLGDNDTLHLTRESPGRYEVRKEIGRGGQARVMLAKDSHIGRELAWKEMLPQIADGSANAASAGALDSNAIRFLREARITGRLEHPNIVPVHEVGSREDGTLYYTMRLVRGTTLDERLKRCANLSDRMKLLGTFWDVCKAIAYAHGHGVIHRDLKPANIMVGEFGETVVLDWGLAKVRGAEDSHGTELARRALELQSAGSSDTVNGSAIGTPSYMSPEQAEGLVDEIDERSDVWGLGAVLYEMLTGKPPFDGPSVPEVLRRVIQERPAGVLQVSPDAPIELAAVAAKALHRDKRERYESAGQLAEEVSAYMTGRRVQAYDYSSWELFKRFASRNKTAFAAAAVVLVVIVASLVIVLIAWRREAQARTRENDERMHAHHHLAQAYEKQAERLADDMDLLGARIFATASLVHNPSFSSSPFFDPNYAAREPDSTWLGAGATSLVARSENRLVTRHARTLHMEEGTFHAAWSPDGKLIASADQAGVVHIWDPHKGIELQKIRAHDDRAYSVAFSPDSTRLVSGGRDALVKVWQVGRGEPVLSIPVQGGTVTTVAFSPDGRRIAIGDDQGRVRTVDATTGQSPVHFAPHNDQIWRLAYSPDGRWLASGSWDKTARIWEADSATLRHSLAGHTGSVYDVAFSPDSTRLATAGYDKTARVWDVESGRQVLVLEGSRDGLHDVSYSSDGRRIATSGIDRYARIWDAQDGRMLAALQGHTDAVTSAAFSPDGRLLETSSYDRTIRIWDCKASDGLVRLRHGDWVSHVAYTSDAATAVTSGADRSLRIWDTHTGEQKRAILAHSDIVMTFAISPDDQRIASGAMDRSVRTWDIATGSKLLDLAGSEGAALDVRYSPDGKSIASSGREKAVRLWNADTGQEIATLREHTDWVFGIAFSADGRRLATASADRLIRIWDLQSHTVVRTLTGHKDWVITVVFSPDGKYLYSGSKDATVLQWDVEKGTLVRQFVGHEQWINELILSRDGKWLVSSSDDRLAVLWDAQTGRPLEQFRVSGMVSGTSLAPDAKHLAVIDNDLVILYPVQGSPLSVDPNVLLQQSELSAGVQLKNFALRAP